MAGAKTLAKAKKTKDDEFYTQIVDIELELKHYKEQFYGKTVFCNCDDPEWSSFWKYFAMNFEHLRLKKLIATHYEAKKQSYKLEMYKDETGIHTRHKTLEQNGDFRSPESIELLEQADIIVTNPPFSLFKDYIAQLIKYDKKFIVIGNKNALTYKDMSSYVKDNKVWLGYRNINQDMWFVVPDTSMNYEKVENGKKKKHICACWFTNMDVKRRHEEIILYKTFTPEEYPKYDNFEAINVNKVAEIPCDYDGIMGVPITFIGSHNPEQFEIIGFKEGNDGKALKVNGKTPYFTLSFSIYAQICFK